MLKDNILKQINSLLVSFNEVDINDLEEFYRQVLYTCNAGGTVIISGLGKNAPICQKFVASLVSLGIPARFVHAAEALHGDIGTIKIGDIVLLVSKSGGTPEIVSLAKHLRTILKVHTWLISSTKEALATSFVDCCLVIPISHEGDPWNLVPQNSTVALLVLLQAVSLALISDLNVGLEVFKKNHPGGAIGSVLYNQ